LGAVAAAVFQVDVITAIFADAAIGFAVNGEGGGGWIVTERFEIRACESSAGVCP